MTASDPSRPDPIAGETPAKARPRPEGDILSWLHLPEIATTLDERDAAAAGGD